MPVNSFDNYPMSWRPSLKRECGPMYIVLAKQLEQDIMSGELLPGTKLPPQRELADFLDINVSTVSRAFKICSQKGLLIGNVGSGTYVAYNMPTNLLNTADRMDRALIELGSMLPETIEQPEIIALLEAMLRESDYGRLFQYSSSFAERYQQAAARLLMRAGCSVLPEKILVASGGQNALAAVFAALFKRGMRIGVDPLVYTGIKGVAQLFGVQLVPVAQVGNEMSETGLRYAVKNDGIRAVYIIPDYHNPTTHTMTAACREMIARVAQELDLLVIEDGMNSLLADADQQSIYQRAPECTIFVLSLSKSINPSLRLAYLAAPERYRATLENALYNINLSQSALLLELAYRLTVSGKLDSLLARRSQGLLVRNQLAESMMAGYELRGDCKSLCRWLVLPRGTTGERFEQMALERGVCVFGSERFAVGKARPVAAVRLAICAPESLQELEKGLAILRKLLEELE